MSLVCRFLVHKRKSEQGFILMATFFAMLILIAVSIFALTMTTQDIRTSMGYYCERRSLSAADAGLAALCLGFNPENLGTAGNPGFADNVEIDSVNSPGVKYSYKVPTRNSAVPYIQARRSDLTIGSGLNWVFELYNASVTGIGGVSSCAMTVDISLKHGPVNNDTGYR